MIAKTKRARAAATMSGHMTKAVLTVGRRETLARAHEIMRAHRVRHLPVVERGKLVGMVSQRDLMLIETLPDVNPAEVPVEDAMTNDVFVVAPGDLLSDVADRMADRRLGSAVVMDDGQVVGVFTVTDACRTLADVLSRSR
jgi:acetoin utilization protein AcuB